MISSHETSTPQKRYDILRIPAQQRAKRLENLTALHLLKACQFWTDSAQGEFELRFVRGKDR